MTARINDRNCPSCKLAKLQEFVERETFPYGEDGVDITVDIPVLRCANCNFAITDQRAEQARHSAVCKHMRLLSPSDIQRIRKNNLGMSREVFHAAYGLSPASMERWENGKLFQSEAADTLIRALEDPLVASRLDRRQIAATDEKPVERYGNVVWGRFPTLEQNPSYVDDARTRSESFRLRLGG